MIDETGLSVIDEITYSPIETCVFPQMRLTFLSLKTVFDQQLGMTLARFILFQLVHAGHEISQSEIQQQLGVDSAVVTRIVKQLEADELVARRTAPHDNRYTLVRLTERGCARCMEMQNKIHEIEDALLNGLTCEEISCLRHVLTHIQENACSYSHHESLPGFTRIINEKEF